ncbi:MAG: hypothetical protein RSC36_01970, partial [Ruthenibacterium sp.]
MLSRFVPVQKLCTFSLQQAVASGENACFSLGSYPSYRIFQNIILRASHRLAHRIALQKI